MKKLMGRDMAISVSSDKKIREICSIYVKKGWRIETKGKHKKLVSPDSSRFVAISGTPSCGYASDNFLKDVKRIEDNITKGVMHG